MCFSYAWQYKCGCVAPKPYNNPIYRCSSWDFQGSCEVKPLFSYLDVDCSVSCRWAVGTDKPSRQEEDWFLQNGSYQGAPSEEDYFLNRVPAHFTEPIFIRRKKQAAAVRQKLTDSSEHQEIVAGGIRNAVELSDGEEQGLDLDPDIAEDESKPVEHVSKANFGGRFTRREN
ncbi:hypothetical protein V8E51_004283 [Hyaloscypha variabilis]